MNLQIPMDVDNSCLHLNEYEKPHYFNNGTGVKMLDITDIYCSDCHSWLGSIDNKRGIKKYKIEIDAYWNNYRKEKENE